MKKDRKSQKDALKHLSFTFWVTNVLRICPCFLVQRALCNWFAYGPISWWKNKQGSCISCLSSPIQCSSHKEDALFFYSLIKFCLAICGACLLCLFPQPFSCFSNPTKNQLNHPFFYVAFFKTLFGNCSPTPLLAAIFLPHPNTLGTFLSQSFS